MTPPDPRAHPIGFDIASGGRYERARVVDLTDLSIDPGAAALVPERICRRHVLVPVGFEDAVLVVAMADPDNVVAVDDVRAITGRTVKAVASTATDILEALNRLARAEASWANIVAEVEDEQPDDVGVIEGIADDGPIVRLANVIIGRAINNRASDIHIEPDQRGLRVRYRIDGVLHEVMRLPKSVQPGITSRIKLISDMDIAERRKPQDGRTEVIGGGENVDLRVATLPTMFGEKIVIRVLRKSNAMRDMAELGFGPANLARFERVIRRPHGMVLVTGPTGSGKTTTLYAALNALNGTDKNILTVEDPVEYCLPGAYQVQVHAKTGLTFASALRSILRSDPDTLLVGEIRDRETAQLAIDASMTGHLVLSSLHTNDAASAMTRLAEMGVEPYLVASSIDCVIAQRLIRVLCERCKEQYTPTDAVLRSAGIRGTHTLNRAVGCTACSHTGYLGRTAIHEVLLKNGEIEELIVDRAHADKIDQAARASGMRSLFDDAIDKVIEGVTSIDEVRRALGTTASEQDDAAPAPALDGPIVGDYGSRRFSP